tara:strand:- start:470 stop:577 length:108 start_codon:yes stop_codon:yes gene_type:complete
MIAEFILELFTAILGVSYVGSIYYIIYDYIFNGVI